MNWSRTIILIFIVIISFSTGLSAAEHYASPTGVATWADSSDINNPCSITTGFSNVASGDILFLRGGTYELTSTLKTRYSGTSGAGVITVASYPGEVATLKSDGLGNTIQVENEYWVFDRITVIAKNVTGADKGIFSLGYDRSADFTTIQNCSIYLQNSFSRDNVSCIKLQGNRSDYAYIYNNTIRGQGADNDLYLNCGVQYLGGDNVGTKILNNEIYECVIGIMIKHANGDTSIGSAEIAYNYIHSCYYSKTALGTGGIYGNPVFINIHDNISSRMLLGDNGGRDQGHDNVINHNIFIEGKGIELWDPSEGPIKNCIITNNIFPTKTTYGTTEANNTWNYNIYSDDAAIGANDIGTYSPTYTGGTNPTTISGFSLSASSKGYKAGSDGKDIGVDVSKVRTPSAPQGFSENI